jgi:hypothetical protein
MNPGKGSRIKLTGREAGLSHLPRIRRADVRELPGLSGF